MSIVAIVAGIAAATTVTVAIASSVRAKKDREAVQERREKADADLTKAKQARDNEAIRNHLARYSDISEQGRQAVLGRDIAQMTGSQIFGGPTPSPAQGPLRSADYGQFSLPARPANLARQPPSTAPVAGDVATPERSAMDIMPIQGTAPIMPDAPGLPDPAFAAPDRYPIVPLIPATPDVMQRATPVTLNPGAADILARRRGM